MDELRRRFKEDGYIWLKNLIPRDDVLDVRESYFRRFQGKTNMLKPGTSPRDAIFNDDEEPKAHHGVGSAELPEDQEKVNILASAHVQPEYLEFLHHPCLRRFIREFMGWEKEVMLKRSILRHNVPHGASTGIHYDQLFLRAGEAEFLTAWVPIGDCAANGGGLIYLESSSDLGRDIEDDFSERARDFSPEERINAFNANMTSSGSIAQDAELFAREMQEKNKSKGVCDDKGEGKRLRWLAADYEAGDVVFHVPYMIHGAGRNEDAQGRIRLSCDLRFYEEGAPGDKRWMENYWYPGDGL